MTVVNANGYSPLESSVILDSDDSAAGAAAPDLTRAFEFFGRPITGLSLDQVSLRLFEIDFPVSVRLTGFVLVPVCTLQRRPQI